MASWMIYGANGYTGDLIAREAQRRAMRPVLAGRDRTRVERLARDLDLPFRVFTLDDPKILRDEIHDMELVLNCAGPFSSTSARFLDACLESRVHYLDITGEIPALEHAHSLHGRAAEAGVVLCPGVGFDVIPTDCVASALKAAMPDATHLALGFDSGSGLSPGTAKTAIEGMADGGRIRRDGRIVEVPLAYKSRRIDFGRGEKTSMTIPWGDVSTAYHSTGIPNIEVYLPAPERMIAMVRRANHLRWLLGFGAVQRFLKRRVEKGIKGPDEAARSASPTFVWGEVTNERGQKRTARIVTANGYALTVTGALAVVNGILGGRHAGGAYTPSRLLGAGLAASLPGSGRMTVVDG